MKRTPFRLALASAVTAVIALGTVSAADAAPKSVKSVKSVTAAKTAKPTRAVAIAKIHALREARHKIALLTRVDGSVKVSNLGAVFTPQVRANIATDKANLVALSTKASAATTSTEIASVRATVATYRPEVYNQVVATLRADARLDAKVPGLTAAIATVTVAADAKAVAGADVTAVRTHLAGATAAVTTADAAIDKSIAAALAVHANTPKRGVDSALNLSKAASKSASYAFVRASKQVAFAKVLLASVVVPVAPVVPAV